MRSLRFTLVFILVITCILSACRKDEFLANGDISISTDTVMFDTVFTTVGSTTKIFKIFNNNDQPINVSKIALATGVHSQFRINVDGVSNIAFSDVEVMAGDSLYIFVQVTVDPTGVNSPMLIRDSIIFETNGNIQDVKLVAIGQDVYLHRPNLPAANPFYSIISCNDVWTNDKPHLILGYAVVDSACTLTMMPGTRVHLGTRGVLWVYRDGTLIVDGNKGNEVTFQGARLEPEYREVPGQWGKIWLSPLSKNNVIDYAIIKNGSIGIQVDTIAAAGVPALKLSNTIIKNMQAAALYAQGSHVWSNNCVFANCGQYVAALAIGGKYKFEHCTFANFWSEDERTTPLLALNNYYVSAGGVYVIRNMDSAYFGNCIIYGDLDEEIAMDTSIFGGNFRYKFDHCIVKTTRSTSNPAYYISPYQNANPLFRSIAENDYRINTSGSVAVNNGNPLINIPSDLNGVSRVGNPDIGAYEYVP